MNYFRAFRAGFLGCVLLGSATASLYADQPGLVTPTIAALPILTAATAKHFGMFQDIALSPDHRFIAYTACDDRLRLSATTRYGKISTFAIGCSIEVLDTETGTTRTITQGGDNIYPTWAPTGRYLAYISDVSGENRLYLWNQVSATSSPVTSTLVSSTSDVKWTPDGTSIVFIGAPAQQSSVSLAASSNILSGGPIVSGAGVVVYRSLQDLSPSENALRSNITTDSPLVSFDSWRGDLDIVNVSTGTVRSIATGVATFSSGYTISPDGSALAYVDDVGLANDTSATMFSNVAVVDLHSLAHTIVAQRYLTGFDAAIVWSPKSDKVAWIGGPSSVTQVSVYDKTSGAVSSASLPALPGMFFEFAYQSRLSWNDNGSAYYVLGSYGPNGGRASPASAIWSGRPRASTITQLLAIPGHAIVQLYPAPPSGGNSVIAQTVDLNTWNSGFYNVNLGTRQFHQLYEKQVKVDQPVETADRSVIAYYRQSADQSPDIWLADTAFAGEHRLTHINPDFDAYVFGKARMISWRTAAGQLLHGALMLPSGYTGGRRYPLIVYPYGSSYKSHEINNWGFGEDAANTEDLQTLATRGYAILLPDAPVRTGTPMRDIALTIMPGVDKAIAMGVADPNRLGVMGHSYGGYTVMALIAQTTRFKAAISRAGFSDWTAIYSELMADGTAYGIIQADGNQYGLGGGPWTVLDKFISNSPYYLFNKVTTPVLIVQGTADTAVAPYNADISFVALRHLNKDVEYAKYANVDHTEDSWPFADQLDYMTRMVNWFDKYLCPSRPSTTQCD